MLREAVINAAGRPEVRAAVRRVHDDLQAEIDRRSPRCDASGRCCRFEQFGHRLYVTTIELAAFISQVRPNDGSADPEPGGCPFQVGGWCSVHSIRPFGCRIFFCDASSEQWQREQYEGFHTRLKRLHDELDVPYRYVEWRQALRELGLGQRPPAPTRSGLPDTGPGTKALSLPQLPL
jgi:Fe-S-cluster containining protein